jgi:L-asparaginase
MILGQSSGIEHVATGGTIDSIWSPERDTAVPAQVSVSAEYFQFLSRHGYPEIQSEVLMLKDSREITIDDKKRIALRIAESAIRHAIVTSGTYLMTDVGRRIQSHPSMRQNHFGKKAAMVASLTPMDGFSMSDGGFNLGMAHAALEDLDPDKSSNVVGVVNGIVAPISVLEKDLTTATFESVDTSDSLLGYNHYTIIPAGGTIDFVFNGLDGVQPAETSFVPGYIRDKVRTTIDFVATPPILKDSRNLTSDDIDMVVAMVRQAPSEFVLVTAGVLRMSELRSRLSEALAHGDDHDRSRRVVLTGARYMLHSLDKSDAPYNLGYAHGKLGTVQPGAHIALAGRLINDDDDPLRYVYTPEELAKAGSVNSFEI